MYGGSVVLGAGQSPYKSMVQEGSATTFRIVPEQLLEACQASPSLQSLLLRYIYTLSIQVASTAASNAQRALPERLARWLLMCPNCADSDQLELTHEFMSTMLAVRRSGVTVTLHSLEAMGAIKGTRGIVQVVDRSRLEEIAGSSYGLPEQEYSRLIGTFGKRPPQLRSLS